MNVCLKQLIMTCRLPQEAFTKKYAWTAQIGFLRLMLLAIGPVPASIRYQHDRGCLKWKHIEKSPRSISAFWLGTPTKIDYALAICWYLGIAPGQSHGISIGLSAPDAIQTHIQVLCSEVTVSSWHNLQVAHVVPGAIA